MIFRQTKNYTKGTGISKIGWVFHGTLGSYSGAVDWLLNSNRPNPTSAHYVIGRKEGEVTQLVSEYDVAWHAGNISNPSKRAMGIIPQSVTGKFKNPNDYFIGIEFVWGYDVNGDGSVSGEDLTLTDWQYRCALDLIKRSGIPYNRERTLSHAEIASYKADDMLFAVNEVSSRMKPVSAPPMPETWQDKFNRLMLAAGFKIINGQFVYLK